MTKDDVFDWGVDNGDVVLPFQRSIAIYTNRFGQAVIRAERAWDDNEDIFICIDHANIPTVIAALRKIADAPLQREAPPNTIPANDE